MNSLMAMCGGILAALIAGDSDPGFIHNGALAGLVAVCAGSDVMHPIGSLLVGGVAGVIFVYAFQAGQRQWQFDDVLGVWPLHGLCGLWGGIACGIFGLTVFGGMGGVSFCVAARRQPDGRRLCGALAGFMIYARRRHHCSASGWRAEDERRGADLSDAQDRRQPRRGRAHGARVRRRAGPSVAGAGACWRPVALCCCRCRSLLR